MDRQICTSHRKRRAPTGATLVTTLKYNHRKNPDQRRTETTKPLLITEKRPRPGPKGRNRVAFNYECCNYIVIAASLLAGRTEYTLVSGPDGPLTRRYAPTSGKPSSGPLRPRTETLSWLKAGMA